MKPERQAMFDAARNVLLKALPDAWAVYLYGSFSRGEEWPDSDVDLGVLLPPGQQIEDKLSLTAELSHAVRREVDVVDVRRIGNVLRKEILEKGQALFVRQPETVLAWEASAMSDYARHRYGIREILEDFQRTGIGYAK